MYNNKLYKYREFNHYTEQIIKDCSLYFSPIERFNDPFDCKLSFQEQYDGEELQNVYENYLTSGQLLAPKDKGHLLELKQKTIPKLISQIGVLSLSKNYNNILMWSHYSASHTGLAFEFEPDLNSECFERPMQVGYHDNYELLSYVKSFREESVKLMLTKHSNWVYEDEYRCIDLEYQGPKKFFQRELTGIIFGAKAKKCDIQEMINLCKENGFDHVKFKHAKILSNGEFGLTFDNL
ncbi:MAG: DUF2971 domain-containing protein [Sulfurimonas sp.]|jgi:hypothetical protein